MHELALFAGAGGGILGGHLLGWTTICAVENNPYAASVLLARQNDGHLPPFPIWDDVRTFDGKPWRGRVDVISGGFPCQDISSAGKGAGIDGERSGLWSEFARIIGEVRPQYAFVENSPVLTSRGLGRVLGDLAALGYDARWGVLGAHHVGAPHRRDRIWIVGTQEHVAYAKETRGRRGTVHTGDKLQALEGRPSGVSLTGGQRPAHVANAPSQRLENAFSKPERRGNTWWSTEPNVGRVAHGVAARVDRLEAIGNGQVPAVARLAWEMLAP